MATNLPLQSFAVPHSHITLIWDIFDTFQCLPTVSGKNQPLEKWFTNNCLKKYQKKQRRSSDPSTYFTTCDHNSGLNMGFKSRTICAHVCCCTIMLSMITIARVSSRAPLTFILSLQDKKRGDLSGIYWHNLFILLTSCPFYYSRKYFYYIGKHRRSFHFFILIQPCIM